MMKKSIVNTSAIQIEAFVDKETKEAIPAKMKKRITYKNK